MGLDTTHGCWSGSYSRFGHFRRAVAAAAGIDLNDMEGFGGETPWLPIESEPLVALLNHSDCDGRIEVRHLSGLVGRLRYIAEGAALDPIWRDEVRQFADGCEQARAANEPVEFR